MNTIANRTLRFSSAPWLLAAAGVALWGAGLAARAQTAGFDYDLTGNLVTVTPAAAGAPGFVRQPADQVVAHDGTVYFSCVPAGAGPFTYQWLSNGVPIAGATGDFLAVADVMVPTNLVGNGSFESPVVAQAAYQTFAAGATFADWTVAAGNVDLVRSSWVSFEQAQSLDLNGNTPGSLYQDLATTPGQGYYLHFACAGLPSGAVIKTNQVWWNGGVLVTNLFNATGGSAANPGWTNQEFLVTATNTMTRLQFTSLISGSYGLGLDAVSVVPVMPAPAAYSVILSNASGSITSSMASIQFDADGNGLPDAWERTYFGATGQDPVADSDGDGIANADEYREGTDPSDAASFRPRLDLRATPGGSVTVTPFLASYARGQDVQIAATPDLGNLFARWSGGITNTNATVTLMLDSSQTITAIFGVELISGGNYDGAIPVGGTNIYAFTATNGDNLLVRLGTVGFNGRLNLYDSQGTLLKTVANSTDLNLTYTVTNAGVFTVEVSSYTAAGTGSYRLHHARLPGAFIIPVADEGGTLTNGANADGAIDLGDLDMWAFTAGAGDSLTLRLASTGFNANLNLYGPDGALVKTAGNSTATVLSYTPTNSGTFTAVVSSYPAGGHGAYRLRLAQFPGAFVVGDEGGPLTNGANADATIDLADLDLWTFTATNGDSLILRVAEVTDTNNFQPLLQLYNPAGVLLQSSAGAGAAEIAVTATNAGTFTVMVASSTPAGTGAYRLRLAQMPGAFVVPPADEGGALTNGAIAEGTIDSGDLDLWSFAANAGDNIILRLGEMTDDNGDFDPWIRLYGPDGVLLGSQSGYAAAEIALMATNTGTFTVVVNDAGKSYPYYISDTGTYRLHLAKTPGAFVVPAGAAGGPLTNGLAGQGTIDVGGLNLWSFAAQAGDSIVLRIGEVTDDNGKFDPGLRLYGPDGALLGSQSGYAAAEIAVTATNTGTFTVVVGDDSKSYPYYLSDTGTYRLRLALAPEPFVVPAGGDGGPLANGGRGTGTIDVGGLNQWSFAANTGDSLVLRVGELTDASGLFDPWLRLYGPTGVLLDSQSGYGAAEIALTATNTGTFTLVVSDAGLSYPYYLSDAGTYQVFLAKVPGAFVVSDDGAALVSAGVYAGTITKGDLDLWGFWATAGDSLNVQITQVADDNGAFDPWIRLYDATGALVKAAAGTASAQISVTASNTGPYLVVVSDATTTYPHYVSDTGTYSLTLAGMSGLASFSTAHLSGSELILGGSGGAANGAFVLLTSTNVALPLNQWIAGATNYFDATGAFQITNSIAPGTPAQFFRLQVP